MWKKIYLIETPSSHNRCAIAVICACVRRIWKVKKNTKIVGNRKTVQNLGAKCLKNCDKHSGHWTLESYQQKSTKSITFAFSHPGWEGKWGCICLCLLPPEGERLLSRKKRVKDCHFLNALILKTWSLSSAMSAPSGWIRASSKRKPLKINNSTGIFWPPHRSKIGTMRLSLLSPIPGNVSLRGSGEVVVSKDDQKVFNWSQF